MNAAETQDPRITELFIQMREEAGWPQPWIDIMYPGYLGRARAHAILAKQPEPRKPPICWG